MHFPVDPEQAEDARRRLAFDELFALQLAVAAHARSRARRARPLPPPGELVARYRAVLPFELTEHQEHAVAEIDRDLARDAPMQRLLQGDVGSGKTVVALYALLRAVEAGRQGALMAPTETLAEQHFLTVEGICAELGVRVVLLTGSAGVGEGARGDRERARPQIAVGTHALIQRGVVFADLAVAVVDEQHRFGVEQRQALSGLRPHRAAHDRDADPAHARADRVRRARRDGDREAAREPQADRHAPGSARSARARPTRGCASTSTRGGRPTSSAR